MANRLTKLDLLTICTDIAKHKDNFKDLLEGNVNRSNCSTHIKKVVDLLKKSQNYNKIFSKFKSKDAAYNIVYDIFFRKGYGKKQLKGMTALQFIYDEMRRMETVIGEMFYKEEEKENINENLRKTFYTMCEQVPKYAHIDIETLIQSYLNSTRDLLLYICNYLITSKEKK